MILQFLSSFIAILSFSILFNIPKSELIFCGINGVIGWMVYIILIENISILSATFFSIVAVTIFARIMANIRKMPFSIFGVAGILPLVPGAGIYNTIFMIITENPQAASEKGIETLKIAGIIAMGVFIILALPNKIFNFHFKKK